MVDYDRLPALPNFVANRRLNLKFAARLQAKCNIVAHATGNPAFLSNPCNGGKPHSGCPTDYVQNGWYRCNTLYGRNVLGELLVSDGHGSSSIRNATQIGD
jgi:hypothetical protein